MKKIHTVTIKMETNMDADDYGQRITECIQACNPELKFINLVKVDFGDTHLSWENVNATMQNLKSMFIDCGAINCVFVPIGEHMGIKNIVIDHLKVVEDDSN